MFSFNTNNNNNNREVKKSLFKFFLEFSSDKSRSISTFNNNNTIFKKNFFSSQKVSSESTRGWDVFRNPPPKIDSGSMANQRCLDMTMQVLKVIAYLFTFIIVLVSGVVAKGTFLLMTSQLREDRVIPYCNKKLGESFVHVLNLFVTSSCNNNKSMWTVKKINGPKSKEKKN